MNVPVSAFSGKVGLNRTGYFGTFTQSGNLGTMKTFYPKKGIPFHIIALASLSAFILKGDQNNPEEGENFDEIYDSVFDIE